MWKWLTRLFVGCDHDWVLLDKHETQSMAEQIRAGGYVTKSLHPMVYDKKFTSILTCTACGKLKVVRTYSC